MVPACVSLSFLFVRDSRSPATLLRIDRYVDLLAEEFNKVSPDSALTGPAIPIVHNTCSCASSAFLSSC